MFRGLWTLPVFLERLHGALFADSAAGFYSTRRLSWHDYVDVSRRAIEHALVGAGGEVRADLSIGWALPLTLRLGAGWPVVVNGVPASRPKAQIYFALGAAL